MASGRGQQHTPARTKEERRPESFFDVAKLMADR
jgi:hypothetical protein